MGVLDWIKWNRMFPTMIGPQPAATARMIQGLLGSRYLRIDADLCFPVRSDFTLDKADSKAVAAAILGAELSPLQLDKWPNRPQVRLTA